MYTTEVCWKMIASELTTIPLRGETLVFSENKLHKIYQFYTQRQSNKIKNKMAAREF